MQSWAKHVELVAAEGSDRSAVWRNSEAVRGGWLHMQSRETLRVALPGVSPSPAGLTWPRDARCCASPALLSYIAQEPLEQENTRLVWSVFVQREWKTWDETEFLTGLKPLLSFSSSGAVSHCLVEMEFKFKNHSVNYSGRDVILCTCGGGNLAKTTTGNLFLGGILWAWRFCDNF